MLALLTHTHSLIKLFFPPIFHHTLDSLLFSSSLSQMNTDCENGKWYQIKTNRNRCFTITFTFAFTSNVKYTFYLFSCFFTFGTSSSVLLLSHLSWFYCILGWIKRSPKRLLVPFVDGTINLVWVQSFRFQNRMNMKSKQQWAELRTCSIVRLETCFHRTV